MRAYYLSFNQALLKRSFDFFFAFVGLSLAGPVIGITWLLATIDTQSNGFFFQKRVGRKGRLFNVVKIKTMKPMESLTTTVTTSSDPRITFTGAIFRKLKLDELPQLWNVLIGDMSFVGPRPDVSGFADRLKGKERAILSIRPGMTGPATLKYRDEEELLAEQTDYERYNLDVIWPDKVQINLDYIRNWTLIGDIRYILLTVFH